MNPDEETGDEPVTDFPSSQVSKGESLAKLAADVNTVSLMYWRTKTENDRHQFIINSEITKRQFARLIKSSRNIEDLTGRLILLTKWLVGLTIVLAVLTLVLTLDVGNKFRQEYFSEPPQPSVQQKLPLPPG